MTYDPDDPACVADLFDDPEADPDETDNVILGLGYRHDDHKEYGSRANVVGRWAHTPTRLTDESDDS